MVEGNAFKAWFGTSKAVSSDGSPLVLYHGTKSDITVFTPSRGGEYGSGIYLSDDEGAAHMFADRSQGEHGQNVMPVYARLQNPFFTNERASVRAMGVKALKAAGYDGIIATGPTGEKQYVVFDPKHIKSAIGNAGQFDLANCDIRFSMEDLNTDDLTQQEACSSPDSEAPHG